MVGQKKGKQLTELSVDEFMKSGFDSDSTTGDNLEEDEHLQIKNKQKKEQLKPKKTKKKNAPDASEKVKKKKKIKKVKTKQVTDAVDEEGSESDNMSEESEDLNPKKTVGKKSQVSKHKASLEKLKDQDPEFYEFLKNEDQELLNFSASDSASDEDDDGDEAEQHKMPEKLEVASDDSSYSDSEDEKEEKHQKPKQPKTLVTLKMINKWTKAIQAESSLQAIHQAIGAFKAAVQEAGNESKEDTQFKVEGATVFNAIVRLCITEILPVWKQLLDLPEPKQGKSPPLPSTGKKWTKVKGDVKSYLTDLLQLLSEMKEASVLNVILKHLHQLVIYYACFPKLARIMLKQAIKHWSMGDDETTRVLAFLSISKITRQLQPTLLEPCLKNMYTAYVKNTKFTSPSTLPMINFMQRSLVEIFAIDLAATYQYAFVYIRQLAIHLRNAIATKKKDNVTSVYNWQFIHSLYLWARLIAVTYPNDTLEPLIYPLTQTVMGVVQLIPTAKYYPLRFHCVRILNILSESTNTFIPVLAIILEVFEQTNFNKKHTTLSPKPFNFACILKFSKKQLTEKGFKDGLIDQLYELLLEHFHIQSYRIGFPELAFPAVLQIKDFLKKCKIANYNKQIKQILDKVQETVNVITQRRKTASFDLKDLKSVTEWEQQSKDTGTPLSKFYGNWRKLRDRELQYEIAGKERISTDKLPEVDRPRGPRTATEEDRKEFGALFESDSEESVDDETRFKLKAERPKKPKKGKNEAESDSDDYSDFDEDELELLGRSSDDDDDDDSDLDDDDSNVDGDDNDVDDDDDDSDVDDDDDDDSEDEEHESTKTKQHKTINGAKNKIKDRTQKRKSNSKNSQVKSKKSKNDNEADEEDIVQDFTFSSDED